MKTISTLSILLVLSLTSFAQTYRVYTAKQNGNFNNTNTWNSVVRTDGIAKNKYVIPSAYTVTAPSGIDFTDYGNMDVVIAGTLNLASNAMFNLTQASTIDVSSTGEIRTNGIAVVMVGSSLKLLSFVSRVLDGPLFTDFITTGFAAFALSVDYISFTASLNNNNVDLKWSTSNEINNSHFEIQVSKNGRDWSNVGKVKALTNSSVINKYYFTHNYSSNTTLSYRLKQVDLDGKFEYSAVVVLKPSQNKAANIFTTDGAVNIQFSSEIKTNVAIRIMNTNGQVVINQTANQTSGKLAISTHGLVKGIYVVHVATGTSTDVKQVLVK